MSARAAIASIGCALPERVVTTADVSRKIYQTTGFELTNGLVERLTGVRARRYRADDQQSSDLAAGAATQALDRAGVSRNDIDLLIFASCTQDITEPATANILQEKLGCFHAQVLDVKNACNSFLNGLDVADSHVRVGKSRRALVATGETLSMGIDWAIRSLDDLKSRLASLTLGDAGAAAVVEAVPEEEGRGVLTTRFRSYGEKWRLATVLGWKPSDVDVACGHQVTEELVRGIGERCGVPAERNAVTVTDCGNTAAASIPLTLARAYDQGKVKRGTKVLLVGGAAGFSVGVIPLIW
jgi:3-oxoacyl-[acyl-carrier-protein] synthase-3